MEIDVTPDGDPEKIPAGQSDPVLVDSIPEDPLRTLPVTVPEIERNRKTVKHALRQQARRRKKNTTIASGNPVPRIVVKPLPPHSEEVVSSHGRTPTMREVLASIPGFTMKPRKRTNKKLSTAAQLEQTKAGCVDLETPDSILINTNLRHLLNKATFAALPVLYQNKLAQLLPSVDRQTVSNSVDSVEITNSGLNNEFFARACLEWQDRLAEGEFTPENQQKLKSEADKERTKVDPWKLKHFEPIWGDRSNSTDATVSLYRPPIKTTIKLRPSTTTKSKSSVPPPVKRPRTVGAMTRSCTSSIKATESLPIPDLLPIRQMKQVQKAEEVQIKSETVVLETPSNTVEKCIVNISDTILKDDEETIITCPSKRKRSNSASSSTDEHPMKRHTPSPESDKDQVVDETGSEAPSDEISVTTSENPIEDEKNLDENSSSSSSLTAHNLEEISSNETIETVDSLQLHADYKEDTETSSTTTTTDVKSEHEDQEEQEETMTSTPDISDMVPMETDPLQITESDDRDIYQVISETGGRLNGETQEDEPAFQILPNTLILQQEPIVIDKAEPIADSAEKLEASLEESDLVLTQLTETTFAAVESNFEPVEDNFEAVENNFEAVENNFEAVGNNFEAVENNFEAVENNFEAVENNFEAVENNFEAVENNFEAVESIREEDRLDDRFIDAENYVLESGQITTTSSSIKIEKDRIEGEVDIQATLFGGNVSTGVVPEECCWGMVDSSTEKLFQVPQLDLERSTPSGDVLIPKLEDNVQVIPMKEELEVRLEEGTFPLVLNDWSCDVNMDSDIVAAALGATDSESDVKDEVKYPNMTGNHVKLELEVTLTPEIVSSDSMITSTVNTSSSSSSLLVTSSVSKTVIPPTTIVCLPSAVTTAPLMNSMVNEVTQRPGMVQSSSSLPYLALSTSQPIRAVSAHPGNKMKPKSGSGAGNRNRSGNKPPPGAVNLERSYQICQAVIQNSPNRDQLRCQLKPPPSLLAAVQVNSIKKEGNRQTQYSSVTSSRSGSNKTFTPPLPTPMGTYQMVQGGNGIKTELKFGPKVRPIPYQHQRQPSPQPVVVRHVFTSGGQGIPVTMAVLPQGTTMTPEQAIEGQPPPIGQYILVQRPSLADVPRSSSAPPAQHPQPGGAAVGGGGGGAGGVPQVVSVGMRGRPASVEAEHPTQEGFVQQVQGPNPGTQAVTRRQQRVPQGEVYGLDSPLQNYTIIGSNENVMVDHPGAAMQSQQLLLQKKASTGDSPSCACSLKAMVVCKKCGAFCHDDCIGPNKLCRTCFIR